VTTIARAVLLAAGIAAAVAGYLWWYSPERQIRRVLDAVAQGFSHEAPVTGLAAVASASAIQPYFSPGVTVEPGRPFGAITGRDAVIAAAARVHSSTPAVQVQFEDVSITIAPDERSATVDCTAMAAVQDRAGQETVDAREVIITMHLQDGRWVITRARAVDVLEPVTP
jgi:hypothetical protein